MPQESGEYVTPDGVPVKWGRIWHECESDDCPCWEYRRDAAGGSDGEPGDS